MKLDIIQQLGEAALGSRLKRLSDFLGQEVARIYKEQQIDFEPKWFTIASYLIESGPSSVNDIAAGTRFTHPAIVQFTNEMVKRGIAEAVKDKRDRRRTIVSLTSKGKKNMAALKPVFEDIGGAVKEIIEESGFDLLGALSSVEKTLNGRNLYSRVSGRVKKRQMDETEIIRYSPNLKEEFEKLNREWLLKFFEIEPEDEVILSNPEERIINRGGEIFFARSGGEIAGTCAVINIDDETYELAKMAVTEEHQGKQIGKKLALAVIGFAYSKGAKALTLETSGKLTKAVNLYESLGFERYKREEETHYKRKTFAMKLKLK